MNLLNTVRRFRNRHYHPLNRVYLSKTALLHNFQHLRAMEPQLHVAPVLKSNAYGHGLTQVAEILDKQGAPFFCVDSLYEAKVLKHQGIKTPILIMGYIDPSSLKTSKLPFAFVVSNLASAQAIATYQPQAKVHLFVDTGMHREGVIVAELPAFLHQIRHLELNIEGLMSHFATADEPDSSQIRLQEQNFQQALKVVRQYGIRPRWIHLSASAGRYSSLNHGCNMVRIGKALYGLPPIPEIDPLLQPVLKLTSKIADIKTINKGDQVGYGATYTAGQKMTIGILPIGYNDGVDRRLSDKGVVLVSGEPCPIIGRVSMNVTAIDLSGVAADLGQEAVIFSDRPEDPNSLINSAQRCNTIAYDLLVHINPTALRREVTD